MLGLKVTAVHLLQGNWLRPIGYLKADLPRRILSLTKNYRASGIELIVIVIVIVILIYIVIVIIIIIVIVIVMVIVIRLELF